MDDLNVNDYLKSHIRTVPDWPAPGVQFRDITPLLQNPKVFRVLIDEFVHRYFDVRPDAIAGLDARELHNRGTRRLAEGDLAGAEEALRASLGRDDDALRPPALHNLGHVRFGKGKEGPGSEMASAELIQRYRQGFVPLLAPLTLLQHHLKQLPNNYISAQRYFAPYPEQLGLRA